MKRKNLRQVWILAGLILFSFISYAQEDGEINIIAAILEQKLSKAGVKVNRSEIKLSRFDQEDAKKYDLNDKPPDAFHIKTKNQLIDIRSRSVEGLRNGAYWYLHYLGFRFYFPGETWHYIPKLQTAFKPVEKTIAPSFLHRRIWYAYGTGSKKADADYWEWFNANLQGGEEVNAGHSYDGIVNRNKNVFLQHPEYFAQQVEKGKTPPNPKFEPGNEELVQLIIRDAFNQIETKLQKTGQPPGMISMDPSDGGGFSTSPSALEIGGPSEQTFYLANRVAKAVRQKYPTARIGLYSYNLHAAPPKFSLEPNIVVLVATAMNRSAYRTDELIEIWKKKGVQVGIRDYFGVMAWDWDMPGQVKGGKFTSIRQLKEYYKTGIRFFSAETNIGWISRGLGHYAGARLLWNIETDLVGIKKEFYKNMFGGAAEDMEQLFEAWQNYTQAVPLDGDLYQWSKWVESASKAEKNKQIQQRINLVKQYLHYVVLFKKWREKTTDDNLVQLLNYAYRVQDEGIVASYPLFRRLANAAVAGKKNMRFNDPEAVWKQNNKPVSSEETNQNFYADLGAMNKSDKMIVAILPEQFKIRTETKGNNALKGRSKTSLPIRLRGGHKVVFHLQKGAIASLNISSGLIKANQYKTLRIYIYQYNKELLTEGKTAFLSDVIQPRQPLKEISLDLLRPGTYIAVIDDARNGFTLSFSGDVSYAIVAGSQSRMWTFGRNNLVFAVGAVKEFQVRNDGVLSLLSPAGRIIDLQKQKGIFTIQVENGEAGIWKLQRQSGVFHIQGILPFVNADPEFLLRNEE